MTNLDSILKNRDITLPTKVRLVKALVFPVVMYGCDSWTIKKAERRRIDAFELWYWRRLLTVPCAARRSNQSILKKINAEYSLEDLMLKLQYFSHLMQTVKSLKKCLMLGKIERVKEKSLIRVQLFTTPWTVAYQAPPSMGFSRQEYWSGLPSPSPGDLPNTGIEPGSPSL